MQLAGNEWSLMLPEIEFLRSHLKPTDRVFEWGTGATTKLFSRLCRSVTSVEHDAVFAAKTILEMQPNTSVLHVPPNGPLRYVGDDGDGDSFRSYVEAYTGAGVDVVLIDGRARVACARRVAETAPFGPTPETRVFLHDWAREEYAPIYLGTDAYFRQIDTRERLMLLGPKL